MLKIRDIHFVELTIMSTNSLSRSEASEHRLCFTKVLTRAQDNLLFGKRCGVEGSLATKQCVYAELFKFRAQTLY